jgi:tRNA-dihydrouridine synthase B
MMSMGSSSTVRIGKVKIDGPLVLAPMADINKPSFRLLCKDKGVSLVYSEMINAEGLIRGGERSLILARTVSREAPVTVQLFGSKPSTFSKAAAIVEKKADIVDINAGCYVHRVTRHGAGCALMKDPILLGEIVKDVVDSVKIPVTVKMRIGYSKISKNFIECAIEAEKAGASAIALHARTGDMGYSGSADWSAIRDLKRSVTIPVIGNGDVRDPKDCRRMMDETGCDMVMIGRAAVGNPFFFKQCEAHLIGGEELPTQTVKERYVDFTKLLSYHSIYDRMSSHGDEVFVRQQAMYFTTGIEGGSVARTLISKARSQKDVLDALKSLSRRR